MGACTNSDEWEATSKDILLLHYLLILIVNDSLHIKEHATIFCDSISMFVMKRGDIFHHLFLPAPYVWYTSNLSMNCRPTSCQMCSGKNEAEQSRALEKSWFTASISLSGICLCKHTIHLACLSTSTAYTFHSIFCPLHFFTAHTFYGTFCIMFNYLDVEHIKPISCCVTNYALTRCSCDCYLLCNDHKTMPCYYNI